MKIKTGEMVLICQDDLDIIRREMFFNAVKCLERALVSGFSDGDEIASRVSKKVLELFREEVSKTAN